MGNSKPRQDSNALDRQVVVSVVGGVRYVEADDLNQAEIGTRLSISGSLFANQSLALAKL